MKGEEVFEKLKRTFVFNTSLASEEKKRKIFLDVWNCCAACFRRDYNSNGRERNSDGTGFGYLVEEFSRRSSRIPHNTEKGDQIAELLLGFLRNGDELGMTGLNRRLYNPDFLQVEITGRRIAVIGIVEVKSSAEALKLKLDSQIANQESNLRMLSSAIENKKQRGSAHQFFKKRAIVVAEDLVKVIAVPMGEGESVKAFLPMGWTCVEIEFSYAELVFVAKSIWPGFKNKRIVGHEFSEGYIMKFEKEFLIPLFEFSKRRLQNVLCDSAISEIPAREILLTIACLGKIPLLDRDINWTAGFLNRNEFFGLFPSYAEPLKNPTKQENHLLDKLTERYSREHVLFFLSNVSSFSRVLNAVLKSDEESLKRMNGMDDFDLISFLE